MSTALHAAVRFGDVEYLRELLSSGRYDVNEVDKDGWTPLHHACDKGQLDMARMLIEAIQKSNVTDQQNKNGVTALRKALYSRHDNVVQALLEEYQCPVHIRDENGATLLHYACGMNTSQSLKTLLQKYNADKYLENNKNDASLQVALVARSGDVDKVRELLITGGYGVNHNDCVGCTPLHYVCALGELDMARLLITEFKADMTIRDDNGDTLLMQAVRWSSDDVAHALLKDYKCPVLIRNKHGDTLLHDACRANAIKSMKTLIQKYKVDKYSTNIYNNIPLHVAAHCGQQEVAQALIEEFGCDVQRKGFLGRSVLHIACDGGNASLVRTLVNKHKADINARDYYNDTPLHVAAYCGKQEVALALIEEFTCDSQSKGFVGRSVLHSACNGGNASLVRALVNKHKACADINARDSNNDTPLHLAAHCGKHEVVLALIEEFGCDIKSKGYRGRSALHNACVKGHVGMVKYLSKYISPLAIDDYGNTPLFTSSAFGHTECVEALLKLNAPVLIRNNAGKTPKDVAKGGIKSLLERYTGTNSTFLVSYDTIQKHAQRKYSGPQHITRIFVLGNSGAGKSSFIASLKKEGFFESLRRVSESSVPPHTAGIIPTIHTSKHYGRVLFYDFAGDAEYYSSHAAILENVASTRNSDNIFIIVVDLREDSHKINRLLNYWVSFISYQLFENKKPYLVILGSHLDLVRARGTDRAYKFERDIAETGGLRDSACFMLDCCKPGSGEINSVVQHIKMLVKDSPRYSLSNEGSVLLGLLEMDFQHVTACPIQTVISHIKDTKVYLPTDVESLCNILFELHELGLLFMIKGQGDNNVQLVLNMSRLTGDVHQLLFSKEAIKRLREKSGNVTLFHVGIVSEGLLSEVLPAHITKEILIQLQYCQVIRNKDVGTFSTSDQSDSSIQSYLFFPALCSAEKSATAWVISPDLSYGIGWLARARCTDPRDYFPPRFNHVLFLRLVFKFALSDSPTHQPLVASPDHKYFPHYCRMWKTGVYWITEEGVRCMVELINGSTEIVVLTKAEEDLTDQCVRVFHNIISCVMKAKAEFCHSICPEFFLLDSTNESDYLSVDNLFAMDKVETALASSEGVLSVTRNRRMKQERIVFLHKFSLWHSLFPTNSISVLKCLENVSKNLYMLGVFLGLSTGVLDAIKKDFPNDTEGQRIELVKKWLSSSLDPCWWHLAQALKQIKEGVLADEIEKTEGESKFGAVY